MDKNNSNNKMIIAILLGLFLLFPCIGGCGFFLLFGAFARTVPVKVEKGLTTEKLEEHYESQFE